MGVVKQSKSHAALAAAEKDDAQAIHEKYAFVGDSKDDLVPRK